MTGLDLRELLLKIRGGKAERSGAWERVNVAFSKIGARLDLENTKMYLASIPSKVLEAMF